MRDLPPHRRPRADGHATDQQLHDLLLTKDGQDALSEGPQTTLKAKLGGGITAAKTLQKMPTATLAEQLAIVPTLELEAERREFVNQVCSDATRTDVQQWVGKIFLMTRHGTVLERAQEARERRRRRQRGSSVASDSGVSGVTGVTAFTGITGTTGTALRAAGSIASRGRRRPKSVDSDESLVVHFSGVEKPLSVEERLQAFLERRIPELEAHVDAHVAAHAEALRREVDEELAEQFLRRTAQRRVFDGRANYLRWQSARHQVLQGRLAADMSKWVKEAIVSWDPKKVLSEGKEREPSETDLIFEYLTKRAAHIDSGKLPTEIPLFPTLYSSSSLPPMWRDKYLS